MKTLKQAIFHQMLTHFYCQILQLLFIYRITFSMSNSRKTSEQVNEPSTIQMFGVNLKPKSQYEEVLKRASGLTTTQDEPAGALTAGPLRKTVVMTHDTAYQENVVKHESSTPSLDPYGKPQMSHVYSNQQMKALGYPINNFKPENDQFRINGIGANHQSISSSKTKLSGIKDLAPALNINGSHMTQSQYMSIPTENGHNQVPRYSNAYQENVNMLSVSQRSQSVADNMRKRQKWKFQQPGSGININRPAAHDQYRDGHLNELEVRGLNQGATQQGHLLDGYQSKRATQMIGLVINPGFRSETNILNSNSKRQAQQRKLIPDHPNYNNIKNKMLLDPQIKLPSQKRAGSRNFIQAATTAEYGRFPNLQHLDYASSEAQQAYTLDLNHQNRRSDAVLKDGQASAFTTQQTRSKSTFSMLSRGRKVHNQYRPDRPEYKKGEMMNQIISERTVGTKKSAKASFYYDRHLSKQGSNLQRYYRLREELQEQTKKHQANTQYAAENSKNNAYKSHGTGRVGEASTISIVDQRTKKLVKISHGGQSLLTKQRLPQRNSEVSKSQNVKLNEFSMMPGSGQPHPGVLHLNEVDDRALSHGSATNLNLSVGKRQSTDKERPLGGPSTNVGGAKRIAKTSKHHRGRLKHSDPLAAGGEHATSLSKAQQPRKPPEVAVSHLPSGSASPQQTKRGAGSDNMSSKKNTRRKAGSKSVRKAGSPMPTGAASHSHSRSRSHSQKKAAKRLPDSQSKAAAESVDNKTLQINIRTSGMGQTLTNYIEQAGTPPRAIIKTEDQQLQQADSDDEYEGVTRQIRNLHGQTRGSLLWQQGPQKQATDKIVIQNDFEADQLPTLNKQMSLRQDPEAQVPERASQPDPKDHIINAKKMLANLKKVHRYESESVFKAGPAARNHGKGTEQATKGRKEFKLTTQMSKVVKHTNNSVNKVLNTLNLTGQHGGAGSAEDPASAVQLQNIGEVDTATLLNNTNVSIKNLNHSLMKLVAVQQESLQITKGSPQPFLMMDRVPVYLEVNATGMPHPAKITIRADPKRNDGLPLDTLNQIVAQNVSIFVSTQTKNPSQRNNQLSLRPPLQRVFNFQPIGGQAVLVESQDGSTMIGKDQFDKIYLCVQYDMSNAVLEDLYKPLEHLFTPGEPVDAQKILEQVAQLNMQILVRFPKDKEEIQKKRMAAMMKKLQNSGGAAPIDLSGRDGEQKLREINVELTKYYREQKAQKHDEEQSKMMKAQTHYRQGSHSPDHQAQALGSGRVKTRHDSPLSHRNTRGAPSLGKKLMSHTASTFSMKQPQAYSLPGLLPGDAAGAVRYNQLLDMYALTLNQQFEKNSASHHKELADGGGDTASNDQEYDHVVAEQYGMGESALAAAQAGAMSAPIDHIARNAYISSKYRQMHGIRSQLNQDLMHTRMHNSQQRAQYNDIQRRLKSQQWLSKWDEFRAIKRQHVDRVLQILKSRRRVINLISIIRLSKIVRGIIANYELIKAFNMRKFSEFLIAIKLYVHFQRRFKGRYGHQFEHRMRNVIRLRATLAGLVMVNQQERQAKELASQVLQKNHEKLAIKEKFRRFYYRIMFVQYSLKELKSVSLIKDHHAIMRILQEFMALKHFYMSQPSRNKVAARVCARLQQCYSEEITFEIRPKKTIDDQDGAARVEVMPGLMYHVALYDQVCQMKYKLRLMENVQHQYTLLLKYLEQDQSEDTRNFEMVRNCMIETFQRQKEMAKQVEMKEEELYGVDIDAETRPVATGKKEKKGEPKEYDLRLAYRHLAQLLQDTGPEQMEALRQAALSPKHDDEDEDFFDELVAEDVPVEGVERKQPSKKKKEKGDSSMQEVLNNEEHCQRLRADRKATVQLIQYYNLRPDKKLLHATAGRLYLSKKEYFEKACGPARELKSFDRVRIFILDEKDKDRFSFYDEFRNEVTEKGHDYVGLYQRRYRRWDMWRIIFKVLSVHESMAAPTTEKEKKGDKNEDGKGKKK